jgi:hypothetical protein
MSDYFLRFIESDKPAVRALGILLGELHDTEDDSLVGNGFVMVGHLYEPTGETTTDEDGNVINLQRVIADPNGQPYIHANLRTNQDLKAVAESMAVSHPELGAALSDLGRFFLLHEQDVFDDEGNLIASAGSARAPKNQQRVFA